MAWYDQLTTASFRGVAFQVDTIDVTAGDNTVLREYPFQDLPTVFRMGEGVEELKFSAYVIGDDYMEQRDALRQVLTGEGVLIHPTAGAIRVYVAGKFTIKENPTAEGGMARFDLTFVRAEARRYPVGVTSTPVIAKLAAATAAAAAKNQFAAAFSLARAPSWVAARLLGNFQSSLGGVWGQLKGVAGGLGDFNSALIGNYQDLRANLEDLVHTPRALASSIADLFTIPGEISQAVARDFRSAFAWGFDLRSQLAQTDFETLVVPAPAGSGRAGVGDAALVLFGTGDARALGSASTARGQLDQLVAASDQLFETLALSAYVQAAAAVELEGYDEAMAMRQAVNSQCTRLLLAASSAAAPSALTSTSWHDAVQALHTAALGDLQARSRDLVRLTSYTPPGWESVWSISYKLFGTADYADEILAMNPAIRHPLLCPPGQPLRIVRHD
jgi:prophage DNA circulation protein